MARENHISDDCVAYAKLKAEGEIFSPHVPFPILSFSFLPALHLFFPPLSSQFLPSPLPFIVFPRLTSPAPSSPFTRLSSPSGGFAC